jgi:hypothetical protein
LSIDTRYVPPSGKHIRELWNRKRSVDLPIHISFLLYALIDSIRDFLSHFVGPASGDVTDGLADMDIGDQDDSPETQRMKGLKYMSQLVRVSYVLLCPVYLNFKCSNA